MKGDARSIILSLLVIAVCFTVIGSLFGFTYFLNMDYIAEGINSISISSNTLFGDFALVDFTYDFMLNYNPWVGQSLLLLRNDQTGLAYSICLFNFESGIVGEGTSSYVVLIESANSDLVQYVWDEFSRLSGETMVLFSSHNAFVISGAGFDALLDFIVNFGTYMVGYIESVWVLISVFLRTVENLFLIISQAVGLVFYFIGAGS